MLTEKKLERIIGESFGAPYPEKVAAAKILELCEADKYDALQVQDVAWKEIVDKHLADLATAQAQAAVMVAAIEAVGFLKYGHPEMAEWIECRWCRAVSRGSVIKHREDCQRQQALSAAPKVVWRGKLVSEYDDISETIQYGNYISGDVEFFVEVSGKAQASFSKEIEVIILDKQGEGKE